MKLSVISSIICSLAVLPSFAGNLNFGGEISLKAPGSTATSHALVNAADGSLKPVDGVPMDIDITVSDAGNGLSDVNVTLTAKETVYFNLALNCTDKASAHSDCQFYMPGFWYHRNLRSPENAPSMRISDSWQVREDRLSTPLTGIYNEKTGHAVSVLRLHGDDSADCLVQNLSGDIILPSHTSVGFTGFANVDGAASLTFGFPYRESPKRYIRKLTLIESVCAFEKLDAGKSVNLHWQICESDQADYSAFVADTWNRTFDILAPKPVEGMPAADSAKAVLANYFSGSYVDDYDLKYFSGAGLRTDDCKSTGDYEVGFVGRVLLNAFNALEYGRDNNRPDLVEKASSVLASTLDFGFTPEGYFREAMNLSRGSETDVFSIRRQSEGAFAILNYLESERKHGRRHERWEERIKTLLDRMLTLQDTDGSFPRKFKASGDVVDASGGSTPSATLPLVMAYKFYGEKRYLESAKRTAAYLESEIIDKADYFSSTLDANCEDKEASLYASTAMYYLTYVTKGKERARYMDQCRKAAYFCLSWYYLWDVPFSQGQMLGDVNFKSRGWGNVSVENNHIDVFIFEFATILNKLGEYYGEPRFSEFSQVINTSMLQLLPVTDDCYDIAKAGYYPEVVQHTTWDYGRNGKGFYNDIFAPGWTVASLWTMLTPDRVDKFFQK